MSTPLAESVLHDEEQLERGYDDLWAKLRGLGVETLPVSALPVAA